MFISFCLKVVLVSASIERFPFFPCDAYTNKDRRNPFICVDSMDLDVFRTVFEFSVSLLLQEKSQFKVNTTWKKRYFFAFFLSVRRFMRFSPPGGKIDPSEDLWKPWKLPELSKKGSIFSVAKKMWPLGKFAFFVHFFWKNFEIHHGTRIYYIDLLLQQIFVFFLAVFPG